MLEMLGGGMRRGRVVLLNWLGVVGLPLVKGLPVSGLFCPIPVKVHRGEPLGIGIVLASTVAIPGTFGSCAASTFPRPKFLSHPVFACDLVCAIFMIAMWRKIPLTLADHRLLM